MKGVTGDFTPSLHKALKELGARLLCSGAFCERLHLSILFFHNLISPPVSVFRFSGATYTFGSNETNDASPLIWRRKTVESPVTNYSPTVPRLRVILSRRSKSTREGWRKR